MPTFSRLKTWVSNEVLTASDLNAEFNNLLNNMTPTGIDDASASVSDMQAVTNPGGVGSESQATDLLGELKRLRYKVKEIIGGAQWYSTSVGSLSTGGVDTASIADGAITKAKLDALGLQDSSTIGVVSISTPTSWTDITGLTVTITTTGRPVCVILMPVGTEADLPYISVSADSQYGIYRDSTVVSIGRYPSLGAVLDGNLTVVDDVAAGTYTYKARCKAPSGNFVIARYKLLAYEL